MMTPLRYLADFYFKEQMKLGYSKQQSQFEASLCYDLDYYIFKKVESKQRDAYLTYFLQFNSFEELYLDLKSTFQDATFFDYFEEGLKEISLDFDKRFPIEKKKLIKMWNLKPIGFKESAVYS